MSTFLSSFLILLTIHVMLTSSLGLLIGQVGIFSLAHAAVFAMGAYTTALVSLELGLSFPIALVLAVLAAGLISAVVAIPTLRVAGDYFVVASLGLQVVAVRTIHNLDFTGGASGLRAIPPVDLFGLEIRGGEPYLLFSLVLMLIVLALCYWIAYSPFGRILRATKVEESAARALGKNTGLAKMQVTILAGLLAGVGGAAYAHYLRFISPEAFSMDFSIMLFAMVVIGGSSRVIGTVLGPLFILAIPELLRLIELPLAQQAAIRQLLLGLLLILFMFFRPQGLAGGGTWKPWRMVRSTTPPAQPPSRRPVPAEEPA
jgi:branched-chain amino acid transport system permease protein